MSVMAQPTESDRVADALAQMSAELKLVKDMTTALVAELRRNRRSGAKRAKTIAKKRAEPQLGGHAPTDLDIARARRSLRR